ncbi:MAG: metal-dependent hydrolase [Verrucomicrobiota bacterium]
MAGFHTHVSTSTALGVAYGSAGYFLYDMPLTTSAIAAGLCGISGMLPDLDGDTGVPVREVVAAVAAVVPALMLDCFAMWGLDRESTVLAAAAVYLFIRYGVARAFKHLTRHRGMWHSIPAAINVALIAFLITSYQELGFRLFKSGAVLLGFLSHLILDEMWSINWLTGRSKRSHGTAFKLFTVNWPWSNVLAYSILIALSIVSYQSWQNASGETGGLFPVSGAKSEISQ